MIHRKYVHAHKEMVHINMDANCENYPHFILKYIFYWITVTAFKAHILTSQVLSIPIRLHQEEKETFDFGTILGHAGNRWASHQPHFFIPISQSQEQTLSLSRSTALATKSFNSLPAFQTTLIFQNCLHCTHTWPALSRLRLTDRPRKRLFKSPAHLTLITKQSYESSRPDSFYNVIIRISGKHCSSNPSLSKVVSLI